MVSTPQIIGQSTASAEPLADVAAATSALPQPALPEPEAKPRPALDPTRYGDWEKNGRCIDF